MYKASTKDQGDHHITQYFAYNYPSSGLKSVRIKFKVQLKQ